MLVHAALVLVHEGVGFGEDGVDAGKRSGLDGTAQGDTEAALGAGGLELSMDNHSDVVTLKDISRHFSYQKLDANLPKFYWKNEWGGHRSY